MLRSSHKCVERLLEGAEPASVVNLVRPKLLERELVMEHVALQAQILERLVRLDERKTGGDLIALAGFQPDIAVLDHVDAAVPARSGDDIELGDELGQRQLLAVEARGHSRSEPDLDVGRDIGGIERIDRHRPDIRRGLRPRVLEHTGLDGAAP